MTKGASNAQIQKLREENDSLKLELGVFHRELDEIKKKIESQSCNGDLQDSVNFISAEYDDMKANKSALQNDVKKIEDRFAAFTLKLQEIDEAVEAIMAYSYQYNVKIVGVPQANDKETAEETVELCMNLFKELGAKVNDHDIDIAHRLQNRNPSKPAVIVCKFTRRIAREAVISKRRLLKDIDLKNVVQNMENIDDATVAIYDHLTPRKQELLKEAKAVQINNSYAFCWVKNSTILMRKSAQSSIIKINSSADLVKLTGNNSPHDAENSWAFPPSPDSRVPHGRGRGGGSGRGRNSRGGFRAGTRSSTYQDH